MQYLRLCFCRTKNSLMISVVGVPADSIFKMMERTSVGEFNRDPYYVFRKISRGHKKFPRNRRAVMQDPLNLITVPMHLSKVQERVYATLFISHTKAAHEKPVLFLYVLVRY